MDINLAIKILKEASRLKFSDNEQEALKIVINDIDKRRDIIYEMAFYISTLDTDEDICKHIKTNPLIGCEEQGKECISCLIEWFNKETEKI